MDRSATHPTTANTQRLVSMFIVGLLIASLLVAISWPGASAQEGTPEDAGQAEVPVTDQPPVTDDTWDDGEPAALEVEEYQEEPAIPTPTPAPTVVPVNGDFLQTIASPESGALAPGASVEYAFAYQVTTPRSATTFVAEIGGGSAQNGAWTIQLRAGDAWSEAGSRVQLAEALFTGAGATIPLSIFVTAPQGAVVDETITIWLSSSVTRFDGGAEQGVVAAEPVAYISVSPPPPTPAPLIDPTLTCPGPDEYSVPLGSEIELTCEVSVLDSRTGARVAIEPPPGWTVESGDAERTAETLELGPFKSDDVLPTVHLVPITLQAPPAAGVVGDLTIRLFEDSTAHPELEMKPIHLTTIVPAEWALVCSAGSTPLAPGSRAEISCALPEAAWALRGTHPVYTVSISSGGAIDTGSVIDEASFTFSVPISCTKTGSDEQLSVSAALGNGARLSTSVPLEINWRAASTAPVLTQPDIDFGDAQWLGTSYAPAETTVELTVSGAASVCASSDWSIQLSTSSFSNGELEVDPIIAFSTSDSTGIASPGSAWIVATGSGNAVVIVTLTLSLPATVGADTFTGDVGFSISTGP